MKRCTKCGETKPTTEFCKHAGNDDGLDTWCKACKVIAVTKWQAANPEKVKEYNAKWAAKNPEKVVANGAKWYVANAEKAKANSAKWQAANMETCRAYKHTRRALKNGNRLSVGLLEKLFKLQRGKCACCKQPLGDDYHMDHIMPLALGGANTDDNIQLLRATCNMQKSKKHPVDFMQQRGFLL